MPDFERTTPSTPIITTAEAKTHLRQDLTVEDDLIDEMIAASTREVEDYAQIALITQDITATFDGPFSAGRIRLPVGPVASDATATVTLVEQDGSETVLTSSQVRLIAGKAPAIWLVDGVTQPTAWDESDSTLRVEYQAGWGGSALDVPDDLRHAVIDQVAQLYENRAPYRQHRGTPSMSAHAVRIGQRYRRSSV